VAAKLDLMPDSRGGGTAVAPPRIASMDLLPLYLAHSFSHVLLGIYPAVLFVLRQQFHASYTLLGGIFTAATLVYGLGAFPTGLLLNRWHPLIVIRVCLVLAAAAAGVLAAASSTAVMAIGLLLLGLACSPYHTAANTMLSRISGNDARLTAHHGMFGSLGLAFGPAFGSLLAWAVNWRLPFAVGAAATIAVVLYTWTLPPLPNPRDVTEMGAGSSLGVTHVRALTLVFAITICLGFVFRGFETYLPSLVIQRADLLPGSRLLQGGLLASLVYLVGFFGQWWAASLGRHRYVERIYTIILGAQAVALGVAFLLTGLPLIFILLLFSLFHFTTQPIDNVLTGKYTSLGGRGVGYGLSFGLSFGVGSFAAVLGGAIADAAHGQLQWVLLMLAGAALICAACGVALTMQARRIAAAAITPDARTSDPALGPFDADWPERDAT
jgi:FSR family fosmidomycin resistance protein-like MFS transporter